MDKLNALKNWMKPRWRKFVRYLSRLDDDLQKQARRRNCAGGGTVGIGSPVGQAFTGVSDADFPIIQGPNSPNLAVRMGYPSSRDHLDA